MNTDVFFAASIVASGAGLYLLWVLGFQPLFVDEFRDSLFVVRHRLYSMAATGRLSPDEPAYRAMERLINGLIRFAHMFNLSFLLVNDREYSRREPQVDPQNDICRAIAAVSDPSTRGELTTMECQIHTLLNQQMMRASIPMFLLTRVAAPFLRKDKTESAVQAFEREAYNAPIVKSERVMAAA